MNSRTIKGLSVTLLVTLIIMVLYFSLNTIIFLANANGFLFFGIPIIVFVGASICAILIDLITKIIKR